MKALLILSFILSTPPALASSQELLNPNLLPFGEQEAFLGNAGIALEGSSGAVYYNPGALGFVSSDKISVYGNAYTINRLNLSTPPVNGAPLAISASSFTAVPLSSVTVFGGENWTYAFSVNVPNQNQFAFNTPYVTPAVQLTLQETYSSSSLWLGPSIGHKLADNLSVGVSLFGARYTSTIDTMSAVQVPSPASTSTTSTHQQVNDWSLLMVLGGQWRLNHSFLVGMRVQTPTLDLRGRTDSFADSQNSNTPTQPTIINEQDIYSRYRLPFSFGLGGNYSPRPWIELLLDLNSQLPIQYNTAPSRAEINSHVQTSFKMRENFGAKFRLTPTHTLMFGFLYNPSTLRSDGSFSGDFFQNYKGFTLGLKKRLAAIETSLGGFFLWSKATQPAQQNTVSETVSQQTAGMLLTASYKL